MGSSGLQKKEDRKKSKKAKKVKKETKKSHRKSSSKKKEHKRKRSESASSKRKKPKRRKRHRSASVDSSSSASSLSDSESENDDRRKIIAREPDFPKSKQFLREMLEETPSLANELKVLLKMLDGGETAILDGLENTELKNKLCQFFEYSGLVKSTSQTAFSKKGSKIKCSILEEFTPLLEEFKNTPAPCKEPSAPVKTYTAPIGPSIPHSNVRKYAAMGDGDNFDDDDDDVVGPCLPGMKGFRESNEEVAKQMEEIKAKEEREEWNRVRGRGGGVGPSASAAGREDWMTILPSNKTLQASLGPVGDTSSRQFRGGEVKEIDHSWSATPEERKRAAQEKAEFELLGYSKSGDSSEPSDQNRAAGPAVHESIMPSLNPEADRKLHEQMERIRESRGKSLLEKHQENLKEREAAGSGASKPWDRDRDMASRRQLSRSEASEMIKNAAGMSDRFAAPQMTRQFL